MSKPLPQSLRICFVSQKFPIFDRTAECGYLWPLTLKLSQLGHQVAIITPDQSVDRISKPPERVQIYRLTSFRDSALDQFEQLHLENPFDIVHSVDNSGLPIALNKKQLGVNFVTDVKGTQLDQIFGLWALAEESVTSYLKTSFAILTKFLKSFFGDDRKLLKNSDGVFVASLEQFNILERYYRYPAFRTFVIPFGIDGQTFEQNTSPSKNVFLDIGVPEDYKIILTITSFIHLEETKNLLSAFERVAIKKPHSALIIVGQGPHQQELEAHMLNLALASKVWFVNPTNVENIDLMIKNCDAFVNLFSKSSGFEPTVLDAMAAEKIVIASDIGTSGQVITNGVDGYLLRPTEIAALSRILLQIVSEQIDSRSLGVRAREKILKMFDNQKMVEQTILTYKKILIQSGRYKK
ncbi:MAG: glycosyltransferase family 4 protein [Oligoflexia bacterium]|nr:glycosyltransferase family 4 protein [Oligoflexia bacterium]